MKNVENNKNPWKNIYEAIDENYFKKSKSFTVEFLQMCRINLNETQNIPN